MNPAQSRTEPSKPTHVAIYHSTTGQIRPMHLFTIRMGQPEQFNTERQYLNEPHRAVHVETIPEQFQRPTEVWLSEKTEEDTQASAQYRYAGRIHIDEYTSEKYNKTVGRKMNQFLQNAPDASRIAITSDVFPRTTAFNREPPPIEKHTADYDYVKSTPGWGAHLEAECIRHLETLGFTHVSTYLNPSEVRRKTLRAAGLNSLQPIPIREWIEKLDAYAHHRMKPTIATGVHKTIVKARYAIRNVLRNLVNKQKRKH